MDPAQLPHSHHPAVRAATHDQLRHALQRIERAAHLDQHLGPSRAQLARGDLRVGALHGARDIDDRAYLARQARGVDLDQDFVLTCSTLPPGQPCLFFHGPTQTPFGNGFRCVGSQIARLPAINTGSGSTSFAVDSTNLPPVGPIGPGDTRNFQNWYRDPVAGGAGFNLSNGLSVTLCD